MSKPRQDPALANLKGSMADWKRDRSSGAKPSDLVGGRPTRPGHLSKIAKKEWTRIVRLLLERGTITKADASVIELHCELYARLRACLLEIETSGAFESTPEGRVESAASKLATKLSAQIRQTLVQLGLTPAAREKTKKVQAPQQKEYEPGSVGWLLQQDAEALAALKEPDEEEDDDVPEFSDEELQAEAL